MKKIMFNDRYGLTRAVLEGRKTMTRRIIPPIVIDWNRRGIVTLPVSCFIGETLFMDASAILGRDFKYPAPAKYQPKFKAGEIVAVAQSYKKLNEDGFVPPEWLDHTCESSSGYNNKMFVRADLMPERNLIRITNVRMERLQDISEDDCMREGIYNWKDAPDCPDGQKNSKIELFGHDGSWDGFQTHRKAFAALIDKVSGKGTWESNPWVFVYEFELVK